MGRKEKKRKNRTNLGTKVSDLASHLARSDKISNDDKQGENNKTIPTNEQHQYLEEMIEANQQHIIFKHNNKPQNDDLNSKDHFTDLPNLMETENDVILFKTEEEVKRDEFLNINSHKFFESSPDFTPYESYNVIKLIDDRIDRTLFLQERSRSIPELIKGTNKLYDGCNMTVKEFKSEYQKFVSANCLSNQCATNLFNFIKKILPVKNYLPESITSTIDDVQQHGDNCNSIFEIHNCDCGQTIYVGENENLQQCSVCNMNRYSNNDDRYPISLMNYRSIILLIFQLLQTNEFYNTIQNVKFSDARTNSYTDVMDGVVAKKHLEEMNQKWENEKISTSNNSLKPLNLLLCLQYDGAQIFHHSVTNFWPMLLTILNLPASLRKQIGTGTFLISLFTAYSKSTSEKFLFYKLLLPELQDLFEGRRLKANGETYYVQARLILHCYDSRAIESVVKVHGAGAVIGCSLCRLAAGWGSKESKEVLNEEKKAEEQMKEEEEDDDDDDDDDDDEDDGDEEEKDAEKGKGKRSKGKSEQKKKKKTKKKKERNPILPSIIYAGHRKLLPLDHWLRSIGQTQKCCPPDYYDNLSNAVEESYFSEELLKGIEPSIKFLNDIAVNKLKGKCCGDTLIRFGEEMTVYNDGWDVVQLKNFLYYHHCDYRPYVHYARIRNGDYISDGREAEQINMNTRHKKRRKISYTNNTLSIKEKAKSINGVKGLWAFATLPYVDISENLCYDPFHVFKNVVTYFFLYITGKRTMNFRVKRFCRRTLSHPSLYSEDGAIWELSPATYKNIENKYFKSVVLSKGYSSHFRINVLFSQLGNIHGKEMINIFEWAMDYICYSIQKSCEYPHQYLLYFCMFSKLISDLSAPIIEDDQIEELHNRVIEMVCLHEGMFPVSETHMVFHQLIELSHFLRKFGPIRGWWTLPSERGISTIKRNLNKGNYHKFYQRVYTKEFIKEYLQSEVRYASKSNLFAKDSTIDDDNQKISFSDFRTELGEYHWIGHKCNAFQIKAMLEFMLDELNSLDNANKHLHSPLIRLQVYYQNNCNKFSPVDFGYGSFKLKLNQVDFIQFLELLSNTNYEENIMEYASETSFVDENTWNNMPCDKLFRKDYEFVQRLFSEDYIIPIYNKAYIWGISFKGRGEDYYEDEPPNYVYGYGMQLDRLEDFPSNSNNDWRRHKALRLTSKDVSSLCLVNKDDELYFCQINAFSRFNDPMEPLLQDIPFAIVVSRDCSSVPLIVTQDKYTKHTRTFSNLYKSDLSFNPALSIVNLKCIYPCPLAVIHMDENKQPIDPNNKTTQTKMLLFFLLHRNRAVLLDNKQINGKLLNKEEDVN